MPSLPCDEAADSYCTCRRYDRISADWTKGRDVVTNALQGNVHLIVLPDSKEECEVPSTRKNTMKLPPRAEQHARRIDPSAPKLETSQLHPGDVLVDLRVLLEEYSPSWYSERL